MSKLTNGKSIPKSKSKKVSKAKKKPLKMVSIEKFNNLQNQLTYSRIIENNLIKERNEKEELKRDLHKAKMESSDYLLNSCKYVRELVANNTESFDDFIKLKDQVDKLKSDYNNLLLNHNHEKIKDRIDLCKKLEKEIPETLNVLNGKKSALKEVLKSITESLREIETGKEVVNEESK